MLQSIFSGRSLTLKLSGLRRSWSNWAVIALLLLITALAITLRLYHLDAKGLWADEIFTATFASADKDLAAVARAPLHTPIPSPPFWFLVTHFFLKALGSSDAVVRLPSVVAGVLGVLVLYKVGEALFDRRIGLISAFLLAISPMHLHHSQEARFYPAVVLFSLLSLYFLYRGVNSDEKKWWVGFTIATLANLYTHLTALLVLAVEVLYAGLLLMHDLVAARRAGAPQRLRATFALPLLTSLGVIAACYAPMMPYLLVGMQGPRGLGNPDDIRGLELSVTSFLSLFGAFGAGDGVFLIPYLALFLGGLIHAIREQKRRGALILLWTFAPFVIILLLRPKHWFVAKYVIFILPLYLMTVSLGIIYLARSITFLANRSNVRRPPRLLQMASVAALVIMCGLIGISALPEVYAWQNDRWKKTGQLLTGNAQPEDAVVLLPLPYQTMPARDMMAYYGPTSEEVSVIEVGSRRQMEDVLTNHRRVWIVMGRSADQNEGIEITKWLTPQSHVELTVSGRTKILYAGKDQTQLALVEEAKQFTNLTAAAHASIGETYHGLGIWEEARSAYVRAATMEQDRRIWQRKLATLTGEDEQPDEASPEHQPDAALQPTASRLDVVLQDAYPTATATPTPSAPPTETPTPTPTPTPAPHLKVSKELISPVGGVAAVEQRVRFGIAVENDGGLLIPVVRLRDIYDPWCLTARQAEIPIDAGGGGTGFLQWNDLGSLAPGETFSLWVEFTANHVCKEATNKATVETGGLTFEDEASLRILESVASVGGYLFHDETGDGTYHHSYEGVENGQVSANGLSYTTNTSGWYSFNLLDPGTYHVEAAAPAGSWWTPTTAEECDATVVNNWDQVFCHFGYWWGLDWPPLQAAAVAAQEMTFRPTQDATISEWEMDNHGADEHLRLRQPGVTSALLQFDLTGLPAGAEVVAATLKLYSPFATNATNRLYMTAYPLDKDWVEDEVTWLQAAMGMAWNAAGATGDHGDPVGWAWIDAPGWVEFDLDPTELLANDYGYLLRGEGSENRQVSYWFFSSEYVNADVHPQLVVGYNVP